jgi:hypothetical protein
MKSPTLWMVLLVAGSGAAAFLQAHAGAATGTDAQANNAAYRDGFYLGKLSAQRGENPRVARGRWTAHTDRQAFTAGYEHGYVAIARDRMPGGVYEATNAAYRDGLYLGKLDAEQGNDQHIAGGRWSTMEDRSSFSEGYRESYGQVTARSSGTDLRQASLVQ